MGKGVEYQKISTDKFNTVEQAEKYLKSGGKLYACGTCIKSREQEASEMPPIVRVKMLVVFDFWGQYIHLKRNC